MFHNRWSLVIGWAFWCAYLADYLLRVRPWARVQRRRGQIVGLG